MDILRAAALVTALAAGAYAQSAEAPKRFVRGDNDVAVGVMGRQLNVHAHTNLSYQNGLFRAGYSGINELSPGEFHGREAFTFGSKGFRSIDAVFATKVGEEPGSGYGLRLAMPQRLKVNGYVDLLKRVRGGSEAYADIGKEIKGWGLQSWTTISRRPCIEAEVRTPTLYKAGKVSVKGFGRTELPEKRYAFGVQGEF